MELVPSDDRAVRASRSGGSAPIRQVTACERRRCRRKAVRQSDGRYYPDRDSSHASAVGERFSADTRAEH